jgi:hypothetical protein
MLLHTKSASRAAPFDDGAGAPHDLRRGLNAPALITASRRGRRTFARLRRAAVPEPADSRGGPRPADFGVRLKARLGFRPAGRRGHLYFEGVNSGFLIKVD